MTKRLTFISFLLILFGIITSPSAIAKNLLFKADCRHRPPEMLYNEESKMCSGPLIEILDEAVKKIGGTIQWDRRPFQKSYSLLKRGKIDILPRVIKNTERLADVKFFSPIGYQIKSILFAVKKGHENDIQTFEDLLKYRIGAKRGTAYFEKFNDTSAIYKIFSIDDSDLARKFIGGRCHAVVLLDVKAFEKMMKSMKFDDFSYATYRHTQQIGNHYAMSLQSKHITLFDKIDSALNDMTASGKIKKIYVNHKLDPPLTGKPMSQDNQGIVIKKNK
ncbi:MAG: ABC transporter substrate-binding protein [Candidatus Magnetomorum sp.]|nr:ABC transporter substrate-binding protein [Candidatus Magnetomorum sp.]